MVAEYLTLALWGMNNTTDTISKINSEASSIHSAFYSYQGSPLLQPNTNNILNFYSEKQHSLSATTHRHEGMFTSDGSCHRSSDSSLYAKGHLRSPHCTRTFQAVFTPYSQLPPYIYNKRLLTSIGVSAWHTASATWNRRTFTKDSSSWNRFKKLFYKPAHKHSRLTTLSFHSHWQHNSVLEWKSAPGRKKELLTEKPDKPERIFTFERKPNPKSFKFHIHKEPRLPLDNLVTLSNITWS